MNIAIDYDGTIDQDAEYWRDCIQRGEARGHRYFVVTARHRDDEDREIIANIVGLPEARVLFTNRSAKRWFCEQLGLRIDVWIDDDPACVGNGK